MKKFSTRFTYILLNFVILIAMSLNVYASTPKIISKVNPKISPETLGPIAIVWRGQSYVGSNYFTLRSDSKSTGFLLGGLGGLLGGALGAGLRPQIYFPPSKDTKSGAKDIEKEQALANVLLDFNYQDSLREQMMAHVFNGYQTIQNIGNSAEMGFPKVTSDFYKKGKRFYSIFPDPLYDYSSLKSQGVKTVIEIYPQAFFTARTGLSGEATPCFGIRSYFIDLTKNEVLDLIVVSKMAPSTSTQEYDELLKNPEAIKTNVLSLIPMVVEKYAKKLNGGPDEKE